MALVGKSVGLSYSISPRGEAVNYRPYATSSVEVAMPRKITAISAIIIIIGVIMIKYTKIQTLFMCCKFNLIESISKLF